MSVVYVETSALLGWLLGERSSARVSTAIDASKLVVSSVLTLLEAQRSIVRAEDAGILRAAQAHTVRGTLLRVAASWEWMEISASVRARAAARFPMKPVRSLDAIHLATMLEFATVYPDLAVLTLDDRVAENLDGLGLSAVASV